jgi:type I restriction enzyme S subunit
LREVACVVPTSELLVEFAGAVEPMHAEIGVLSRAKDRLAATRNLLLPRLVNGHLDISDIDLGALLPAEPE